MELSPKQQTSELIKNSSNILVLGHKEHNADQIGSMLALAKVLEKEGKKITLAVSEAVDNNLMFLPGIEKLVRDIGSERELIIEIDSKKTPVDSISYADEDGKVRIIVTPKGMPIRKESLVLTEGSFSYDLIIVLDTPDVEKIDSIYDKYTELFFEVPIINIDHHAGNEYFGTVNMVDLTATSTAEILVSVIEAIGPGYFDADVATCLLTGITYDTASFKHTNTTPKALTISAQMLAAGARQQEIIQNLYRTKPINTLKLWGRVLSNLEYDREHRIVWSEVSSNDLAETNAAPENVAEVLDELLASAPGTDVVLGLVEYQNKLYGYLKGLNGADVLTMAEAFGGKGKALSASFVLPNKNLIDKDFIISKIFDIRDGEFGKPLENFVKDDLKTVPVDLDEAPEAEEISDLELASLEAEFENAAYEEIPSYEEIFTNAVVNNSEADENGKGDDSIAQALESIDSEIETGSPKSPNIDIEEVKSKDEALRQIGEVMKGYTPGKALDEKGNQPIDPEVWGK